MTFNGKNEKNVKFEYFEDLFHTTLRMQPNLAEDMKINHFHAHLRGLTLKTFKNIQRTPNTTLEDILKSLDENMWNRNPVHQRSTDVTDSHLTQKIRNFQIFRKNSTRVLKKQLGITHTK